MRRGRGAKADVVREVNYRRLRNPFPPMSVVSDDRLEAIHEAALTVLEDLGLRVLLPEARALFAKAGARVEEDMVWIGRDIVAAALASAPKAIRLHGGTPARDVDWSPGALTFMPASGTPHATDRERGRRPGTARDYRELIRLVHHFDVLHLHAPIVEPQDVPVHLRHYFAMDAQMRLSDKVPNVYARGRPQVEDSFEMVALARGLSDEAFHGGVHCWGVINSNSPRTLDIPMAQGLIDFARHKQVTVMTPFTLMGAMAPITVAGAMTLSHAEALAGIALTQCARAGAPVMYGTFTSNVDMKSGAPAFGTPEHVKASLLAGQLARRTGLPWRCAAGSASNLADAQGANENQMGLWGCLLAGATTTLHSTGWLEGGLTVGYEKLVVDVEVLQMVAELCAPVDASDEAIGLDALAEVAPQGHFFAAGQTMRRYATEFYAPILHDFSNFGTWTERGGRDAEARATDVWKAVLAEPEAAMLGDRQGALDDFVARRTEEGGAPPES
ncbi:trimethylamine methyltransferase family protein [Jannaschia sp. W003]|uniref:trimethylamine methyltransferase family protein n=1 Tax=Jannaschia sp. W003 TaxID=2867012 RepID=UPI0021A82708|nr:trimethylamine methyltransferase family protein [Jannaschia sp. W003]